MCGRLNQFAKIPSLRLADRALNPKRRRKEREDIRSDKAPVYNICPSDYGDALMMIDGEPVIERMRFGLIPHWAKGGKRDVWRKFMVTFNARCETVFDLASYRKPIRTQRCLVPVSGWHEWPERTTPYYIHRADDAPLFLAGIWDEWESHAADDMESGPVVTSMSVITTPPGRYMGKFHDRSPLVLDGEAALSWMQPGLSREDLRQMMQPGPDSFLEAWRVSTAANSSRNKTEEVILPIEPPVPQA